MSAFEITMLLHFYSRSDPYPWDGSPAEIKALELFRKEALITEPVNLDIVKLSQRGEAYVSFLIAMPIPVAKWALPGFKPQ